RWWAMSLLIALLLAGGWGFVLYRTQKKLRISEAKLKERDEAKAQLLTVLAHDMRSPLDLSRMRLSVLRQKWQNFTQIEVREKLRELEDQFANISRLTHTLLHWTANQSGKLTLQLQSVELDYILADEMDLLEDFARAREVDMEFHPSAFTLHSDPNLLRFIFRNLLSNAIKFSDPGTAIQVHILSYTDHVQIQFVDHGLGMSDEVQAQIFRMDHVRINERGEKGYGIGLLMCQRFAARLGGSISVESERDVGSAFTVKLPL
ncbi:MAG: HAMP domain-containing sensor histidine kinase, partial [Bacteroidota bacterium]